jgi:hypothetical protein
VWENIDMTDFPNLCILLLTYNRLDCAEKTLRSALDNLTYSGPLCVHIADDGSGPGYREKLIQLAEGYAHIQGVGVTNSEQGGYGRNYNLATQVIHGHSSIVLPLEDDWELLRHLDLDHLVRALVEGKFGCIRLGYLGITQPLKGELVAANERLWLLLDPASEERHIFAGHPRLETIEWEKSVGPWPERLDPNMTEFNVCAIPGARSGVVWPICILHADGDLFVHIGVERVRHSNLPEAILVETA